jgi:hypothetical protein
MKKFLYAALGVMSLSGIAGYFWPASADSTIQMDSPVSIGGIQTVCTGIGDDAQHDPRWLAFPIRIEFSNGGAQYLSGAHVELSTAGGKALAALDCAGPWVLFQVGPGSYKVTATLTGQQGGGTSTATFSPPAKGQKRVVLGFHLQANQ